MSNPSAQAKLYTAADLEAAKAEAGIGGEDSALIGGEYASSTHPRCHV